MAEPAARCRPWGRALAVSCLAVALGGLLRLIAGLWAVHILRLRGRPVDEPDLGRLLLALLTSMACRRRVELRETSDLTAPATAGWRRPVILLPEDWRSWDDDERLAVLATSWPTSAGMTISRGSWPGPPGLCTSIIR